MSAQMVKQAVIASDLKIDSVDRKAALLYLALTVPAEELAKEGHSN